LKRFKVGVIGIGDISDVYINNLKQYPIIEVVGCAGRSLAKAKLKAAQHGIRNTYADGFELIADPEIDIVLNLTVPEAHYELNRAAIAAGKHVYTEKPLATTFAQAKELMDMATANGLRLASAPDTFLGGRLQTCRELIDDDKIGDIIGASAFVVSHGHEWHHPNPDFFYREGGGPLLDIGPYYITALLSLLGPIQSCAGMSRRSFSERTIESQLRLGEVIPVDVDTHIIGNYAFSSGAIASIIASFDVWDSELPRIEIYGTKGTLCIRDIDPVSGPNLFGGEVWLRTRENYRWKGFPRQEPFPEWMVVENQHPFNELSHSQNSRGIGLIDMVYAIANNRTERASGAMALHMIEAMEGLMKSARERCYYQMTTTFNRPEPLPVDFPDSEAKG